MIDIEIRRYGEDWENYDTTDDEGSAYEMLWGTALPDVAEIRIIPTENAGGEQEFLYWEDGRWVDPSAYRGKTLEDDFE